MKILPFKIKLARHRKNLSMDELVARMGEAAVSKMSISKFERGLMKPSPRVLQEIADICEVPVSFFSVSEVKFSPMTFRFDKDMPSKKANQIKADVEMKIEAAFTKEEMIRARSTFVNPLNGFLVRTYSDAEMAAMKLRECIVIGNHPIHSVYEMIQELGVMVVEIDVDSEELLGTSTYINGVQPVVLINTRACTTTERKRFTALHELAHLILTIDPVDEDEFLNDNPGTSLKTPNVEKLCHWFANAMLIAPSSLARRLGEHRTDIDIDELISIRNMYGISIAATVHRLHDLGMIPDSTYNHLYDDVINKNRMEEGWGCYPVMEVADRYELLEKRILMEEYGGSV